DVCSSDLPVPRRGGLPPRDDRGRDRVHRAAHPADHGSGHRLGASMGRISRRSGTGTGNGKEECMSKPHNILIVGGGVAGLASALALKKAGIDSVVLEARSPDETTSGVFLTLGSNGLDALRTLDADARVREAGFPTPTITLRSGTGRRLGETPISGTAPDAIPSVTIKRSDLYAALRDEVTERGLGIEYGRKLVDVRRAGEGVRAVFADGSE